MRVLAALVLAAASTAVDAHEFWIQPDRHTVARGDTVQVGLRVGAGWPGEPFALQARRVVVFSWLDARGETSLVDRDGAEPAGRIVARAAGTAIAAYRSNDAVAELDGATFETYLREEGLEHVSAERAARGLTAAPVRERYSRCAKAIVTVRDGSPTTSADTARATETIGLDLEIVPLVDPRALARGGPLPVRVTWRGKPVGGLLVKALAKNDPSLRIEDRTDASGRATLALPAGGVWLVNVVRIEAAPAGSGFDWQSTWSSLTFEAGTTGR